MGTAEFDLTGKRLVIHSHVVTYGNAASEEITDLIRHEIESMWNEPQARVPFRELALQVVFEVSASYRPDLRPDEVFENIDASINFFRIEKFAQGNISFVDGLGSNTGYFLLENLYARSTTAAHEYGHTLGLKHPLDMDLRGKGVPGIMYPRGTLVDAPFQYNPEARAGDSSNGGTMHPKNRRVLEADIQKLKLHRLSPDNPVLGEFTSIWHPDHAEFSGDRQHDA